MGATRPMARMRLRMVRLLSGQKVQAERHAGTLSGARKRVTRMVRAKKISGGHRHRQDGTNRGGKRSRRLIRAVRQEEVALHLSVMQLGDRRRDLVGAIGIA